MAPRCLVLLLHLIVAIEMGGQREREYETERELECKYPWRAEESIGFSGAGGVDQLSPVSHLMWVLVIIKLRSHPRAESIADR